jgi:hypothetical protein
VKKVKYDGSTEYSCMKMEAMRPVKTVLRREREGG